MVYALVAIKTLACVDRLVTVPLVELLRRGVSEEDVLHAGDELVARAVARLMTPEGWEAVDVALVGSASNKRKGRRRQAVLAVRRVGKGN